MEKERGSSLSSLKSQYLHKASRCRIRRRGGARAFTQRPAPPESYKTYLAITNLSSRLAYIFGWPFRLECFPAFSLALSSQPQPSSPFVAVTFCPAISNLDCSQQPAWRVPHHADICSRTRPGLPPPPCPVPTAKPLRCPSWMFALGFLLLLIIFPIMKHTLCFLYKTIKKDIKKTPIIYTQSQTLLFVEHNPYLK